MKTASGIKMKVILDELSHLTKEQWGSLHKGIAINKAWKVVDSKLCELVIDDINFKPEDLSHEELVDLVKANSKSCEEILLCIRGLTGV